MGIRNPKTKAEHNLSHTFRTLDPDDFDNEREYRKAKQCLKKKMSKLRRSEHRLELEDSNY
jgi:hypothetical protein